MSCARLALTGPHAAALYGLDGYRDLVWPARYCAPLGAASRAGVVRTRWWEDPVAIGDTWVAPLRLVLRHLGDDPDPRRLVGVDGHGRDDGLDVGCRVELALEHALRSGEVRVGELRHLGGSRTAGDQLLRSLLAQRGDEPPTESYAETRAVQLLRQFGMAPWRQVPVVAGGRIAHRVDFVIPRSRGIRRPRRPELLTPADGLLLEVDGRGVHEPQFERDHRRDSTYDALGFHWLALTASQILHEPSQCHAAILGAFRKAFGSRAVPC